MLDMTSRPATSDRSVVASLSGSTVPRMLSVYRYSKKAFTTEYGSGMCIFFVWNSAICELYKRAK